MKVVEHDLDNNGLIPYTLKHYMDFVGYKHSVDGLLRYSESGRILLGIGFYID